MERPELSLIFVVCKAQTLEPSVAIAQRYAVVQSNIRRVLLAFQLPVLDEPFSKHLLKKDLLQPTHEKSHLHFAKSAIQEPNSLARFQEIFDQLHQNA